MDTDEAKRILALYRPGDTDSPDPRMAQALKLAREDPQLAAWFGQHCAAHVKFAAEPEAATAPPVLKESPPADAEHTLLLNRPVFIMAAIAGLTLLAAALWSHFNSPPKNTFDSYRDRMARLVQRSDPMKTAATDQAQIRQYFRAQEGAADFSLPKNLEKLPGAGAAVFNWHSQPVSLLGLDAGGGTNLYLFLIKQSAFANPPTPGQPQFNRVGRLMTASWTLGDTIYLLTGPVDEAALKSYEE
jgi:hypothetical protein